MPHRIYSIESRKGGVGKTTVALNLATILVNKGPVLLLDCDITGTSIVDPAKNSPFWDKETNVLTEVNKKRETKDINLIHFFLNSFIKGERNVRGFINLEKLKINKVNVLGSFLYGTPREAAINSSWLMDELHSYWMVELIQQIIKEFEGLFSDKTVHIVIDNSPGFTSFNQSLHDYMFEEGPIVAKFLLVSTLDSQDLQANMEAAAEIRNCVENRTAAANYYKLKENDENNTILLADKETLIETNEDIKEFFFHLMDNEHLLDVYTKDYECENFLALVLNKVPQALQDDDTNVAYEDIVGERIDLFHQISGSTDNSQPKNVVYYDDAIVYQYYLKYLHGRMLSNRPSNASYWTRRFREIGQQVDDASHLSPIDEMIKLNSSYEGLQVSLTTHGYAHIAKQLLEEWAPMYAMASLRSDISNFPLRRLYDSDDVPSEKMKDMLHLWNMEQLGDLKAVMGDHTADFYILSELMDSLESLVGFHDDRRRPDSMALLSLVLYVFRLSFLQWGADEKTLNVFCRQELFDNDILRKGRGFFDKEIVVNDQLTLKGERLQTSVLVRMRFIRLYRSFCKTILKITEQKDDFNLILSAVKLYVPSITALSFSKEMTDYISEVVYRKRKSHNHELLADIRARSYVMKNMQDVLYDNVIKAWK